MTSAPLVHEGWEKVLPNLHTFRDLSEASEDNGATSRESISLIFHSVVLGQSKATPINLVPVSVSTIGFFLVGLFGVFVCLVCVWALLVCFWALFVLSFLFFFVVVVGFLVCF